MASPLAGRPVLLIANRSGSNATTKTSQATASPTFWSACGPSSSASTERRPPRVRQKRQSVESGSASETPARPGTTATFARGRRCRHAAVACGAHVPSQKKPTGRSILNGDRNGRFFCIRAAQLCLRRRRLHRRRGARVFSRNPPALVSPPRFGHGRNITYMVYSWG